MTEPVLAELPAAAQGLVEYWAASRSGGVLPPKSAIDPLRLRSWIGDVSIIDYREGPMQFWVRLHGANLSAKIGTGFERKFLEERIPEGLHDVALEPYHCAVREKLPVYSIIRPGLLTGVFEQLERLILPFAGEGTDEVGQFLVWAGPSKRNRYECETVYGTAAATNAVYPLEMSSMTVLSPDPPIKSKAS